MSIVVTRRQYPAPPTDFVADTDALTMWVQYERYKHGNELWEFDEYGLMKWRDASINDYRIEGSERRIS